MNSIGKFGLGLIIFGIIVILFPAILAYLIGGFFLFVGANLIAFGGNIFGKKQKGEDYIKFGKYKIYR